jgi:hypothetical protein
MLVIVRRGLGLKPNAADTAAIALNWESAMWTPSAESYSWKPIESAPLDEDVSLQVTDGRGKPYALRNPSRLTAAGWVSSGKGTPLEVTPVLWRPYYGSPPPR